MELPYDPAIPLLDMYSEKTIIPKDTCGPLFKVTLFTIAKTWKQHKCPSAEEWINKTCYILCNYSREYGIATPCQALQ